MPRTKKIAAGFLCGLFTTCHIVATCGLLGAPEALKYDTYQGGWESGSRPIDANLVWSVDEWDGAGKGATRLLYKDWKEVHGTEYIPRHQGKAPSCVGQANAAAVDFLAAVEIRRGEPERAPPAQAAACVIYGMSRIEIGGLNKNSLGGSHNIWAAQALQQYGAVARLNYPLLNQDLRVPSPSRAVEFGAFGVPVGIERIAQLHPVKEYISIDSYEEARDALYMGCPVTVGSSVGFGDGIRTRDKDGFLNRPRRLFWESTWNHAMVFIGVCDKGRKGCLCLNSWGSNWVKGPTRFPDEPAGCFWIDADIVDKMVKQGDSFALRGFEGYQDYRLWSPK